MDQLPPSTSTHEAALDINAPWRRPNFWGLILGPLFLLVWLTIPAWPSRRRIVCLGFGC